MNFALLEGALVQPGEVKQIQLGIQRRDPPCKDGEDRWVKLTPATIAALRAHCESMDLEGSLKRWTPEQRELVFPNNVGRIGADLRYVKDQMVHRRPH